MYKYTNSLLPDSFTNMFGETNQRSRNVRTDKIRYKTLDTFPKAKAGTTNYDSVDQEIGT